ncbi:unnamed protein product [Blepharisma stoltei]|uniref:Uncharacterized protein n=1 Tax=Blepharisma stoltei TaxID=1481888 RepID=A0AAU9IS99_9CILI|nr:unnamed protein product [Blepharisma stoltei]
MFLFRGKNTKDSEVPKIPDSDNQVQIQAFIKSMCLLLTKEWKISEEFSKAIEFLSEHCEHSQDYIIKYLIPYWEDILKNSIQNPEQISPILDITQSCSEKFPNLFNNFNHLHQFLEILQGEFEPIDKHRILVTLRYISNCEKSLLSEFVLQNKSLLAILQEFLMSTADYLRNESIILLRNISINNDELCKDLGFQGLFENLLEIIRLEEGKIIEDCLELMKTLLSEYNKNFIREISVLIERLRSLLVPGKKMSDKTLDFIIYACKDKSGKPISSNQMFFSELLPDIAILAFPQNPKETQNLLAIELMSILLQGNLSLIKSIINPSHIELFELLESIPIYCLIGNCWKESFSLLWNLTKLNQDIQSAILSKITCMPGYVKTENKIPSFNYILNEWLEDSILPERLTKLLELLLINNEISKELGANLPIDLNSGTLLLKVFNLLLENILTTSSVKVLHYARLLLVWMNKSPSSCNKIRSDLDKNIELVLDYIQKEDGIAQCLCLCLLGIIGINNDDGMIIPKLALRKIGYTDACSIIDKLFKQKDFTKNEQKSDLWLEDSIYSFCLLKEYRPVSQAVKKVFLKEITDSAPESESDLAKLVQAQDILISNLQNMRKGGQSEELENLSTQIKQLNEKNSELKSELTNERILNEELKSKCLSLNLEKKREVRGIFEAMVNLQEKYEISEYEKESLIRENKKLFAVNERLRGENKVYTAKRPEIVSSIQMLEIKEQNKSLEAEIEYLKNQLRNREIENKDLLELVGKQNSQIEGIKIHLPELSEDQAKLDQEPKSTQTDFEKDLSSQSSQTESLIKFDNRDSNDQDTQTVDGNDRLIAITQTEKQKMVSELISMHFVPGKKKFYKNQNMQCGGERKMKIEKIKPQVFCRAVPINKNKEPQKLMRDENVRKEEKSLKTEEPVKLKTSGKKEEPNLIKNEIKEPIKIEQKESKVTVAPEKTKEPIATKHESPILQTKAEPLNLDIPLKAEEQPIKANKIEAIDKINPNKTEPQPAKPKKVLPPPPFKSIIKEKTPKVALKQEKDTAENKMEDIDLHEQPSPSKSETKKELSPEVKKSKIHPIIAEFEPNINEDLLMNPTYISVFNPIEANSEPKPQFSSNYEQAESLDAPPMNFFTSSSNTAKKEPDNVPVEAKEAASFGTDAPPLHFYSQAKKESAPAASSSISAGSIFVHRNYLKPGQSKVSSAGPLKNPFQSEAIITNPFGKDNPDRKNENSAVSLSENPFQGELASKELVDKNPLKREVVKTPFQGEPAKNPFQGEPAKNPFQGEPAKNPLKGEVAKTPFQGEPAKNPFQEVAKNPFQGEPLKDIFQGESAKNQFQGEPLKDLFQGESTKNQFQGEPLKDTFQGEPAKNQFQGMPLKDPFQGEPAKNPFQAKNAIHAEPAIRNAFQGELAKSSIQADPIIKNPFHSELSTKNPFQAEEASKSLPHPANIAKSPIQVEPTIKNPFQFEEIITNPFSNEDSEPKKLETKEDALSFFYKISESTPKNFSSFF